MRVAVVLICLLNQQNVDKLFNDSLILQFINVVTKRYVNVHSHLNHQTKFQFTLLTAFDCCHKGDDIFS